MIQSLFVLDCRGKLATVLTNEIVTKQQYQYLELYAENWLIFKIFFKVLEQLEVASVFLSEESNVFIPAVLPVVHSLIAKLAIEADPHSTI